VIRVISRKRPHRPGRSTRGRHVCGSWSADLTEQGTGRRPRCTLSRRTGESASLLLLVRPCPGSRGPGTRTTSVAVPHSTCEAGPGTVAQPVLEPVGRRVPTGRERVPTARPRRLEALIGRAADDVGAYRGRSTRGLTGAALSMLLFFGACASEPPSTTQAAATTPAGWITTTSERQDLRLTLPAWLEVFENRGAVFANEVIATGEQGLQLMAEGPRTAEPQPRSGEDVRVWLERKVGAPGQGEAAISWIDLPAGPAFVLERVDRAGTPSAWRITAYAIETDVGVVFLLIDGPQDSWAGHEDDARLIPHLLRVASGFGR
jgi:hypothetical protein